MSKVMHRELIRSADDVKVKVNVVLVATNGAYYRSASSTRVLVR